MQLVFLFLISISLLWVVGSIIHAKKRGALRAMAFLAGLACVLGIGLFLVGYVESDLLPVGFLWFGALLIIGTGAVFVFKGITQRTEIDEVLLKLSPAFFNPDRIFFERFGKKYFYFKSLLLGIFFIAFGIFLILRKTLQIEGVP